MINQLRREFQEIYFNNISTTKGLEELAKNIGISKNSLRRFLQKIKDDTTLRVSTLTLIAQQLGYKDYADFCDSIGRQKYSLDFELLDIYYGIVKGQGTTLNETRFQKANYYFAQKIISDPLNLKEFVKRFADNYEALEYVLAWHPSYENIANSNYQAALLQLARSSPKAHLKVFAYSFVVFGKFMSEKLAVSEAKELLAKIEKYVYKMREEEGEFHAFPEARYVIAKTIYAYLTGTDAKSRRPDAALQRLIGLQHISASPIDKIIFGTYVTNILNILHDYENADLCIGELLSEKTLLKIKEENPHLSTHIFLYKLNWVITQFHLGRKDEALLVFETLPSDLIRVHTSSFDSKIYFELKYLYFARSLYPKRQDIKRRFDFLVEKTQFTFLHKA